MPELNPIDIINLPEMPEEQAHDFVPKKFDQFVGQQELKQKLAICYGG